MGLFNMVGLILVAEELSWFWFYDISYSRGVEYGLIAIYPVFHFSSWSPF